MFLLDGKPLSPDVAFTTPDGTQYPANWLRLASPEERAAIGITEAPDPEQYDQRFYWGPGNPKLLDDRPEVDQEGNPLLSSDGTQVVTKGLKSQFISQIKQTAGQLLAQSDWKVIRGAEGAKALDKETKDLRNAIRAKSDEHEAAILACTTVEELAALQFDWPKT